MLMYVGNFWVAGARGGLHPNPGFLYTGFHFHTVQDFIINVEYLWSLCVEEQYYLLWPAVVWLIRSRRTLLRLCLALLCVEPLLRGAYLRLLHPGMMAFSGIYHNTLLHSDCLIAGSALALWLRDPGVTLEHVRRLARWSLVAPFALVGLCFAAIHSLHLGGDLFLLFTFSAAACLSTALVLFCILPGSRLGGLLEFRPLAAWGRISYGLYFYHVLLLPITRTRMGRHSAPVQIAMLLLISTAVAWASFRFYESPFLRLKHKLAPRPGGVADPPPSGRALAAEPGL